MNLAYAIAIAAEGFKNRTDKGGKPYVLHCLRVMNNLHTQDEELMSIAVLHDVPEDKIKSTEELLKMGFSSRVIRGLELLDHDAENVSYDDYIKALAHNDDARRVKLADLQDNSDINRLKGVTKKDFDRIEKYHKAYLYLSEV